MQNPSHKHLQFLFSRENPDSQLINISNHTTLKNGYLIVRIGRVDYVVVHKEAGLEYQIPIKKISNFFQNGYGYPVRFSLKHHESKNGIILFNNIPPILCSNLPEINFSVCLFNKEFTIIRFAKKSEKYTPNFALGFFKYHQFIKNFIDIVNSSNEYRLQILWKMFVHFLHKIGYFDIFDINNFQSIFFIGFLKIFSNMENIKVIRNLFCSFVWRLLSNNCWFMIFGNKYQTILGNPSRELIKLFEDSNPHYSPIVNFISDGLIGVITPDYNCVLVSISTTFVVEIGNLNKMDDDKYALFNSFGHISTKLFCNISHDDDDNDNPYRGRQSEVVNISCIQPGFSRHCEGHLVLLVFKHENNITFFIKCQDGTFEYFCPYLVIMLYLCEADDKIIQLINQLTNFSVINPYNLIEALVLDCGFEQIFDRSATIEQIIYFLVRSNFGVILQRLMCDFESFPERLREHLSREDGGEDIEKKYMLRINFLKENEYVSHLRRIFEDILEKMQERKDLGQEIKKILEFLDEFVKFLMPL